MSDSQRPLIEEMATAGRLAVRGEAMVILSTADARVPRGYRLLRSLEQYAEWWWEQNRRRQEWLRETEGRLIAEEQAYAARRRSAGLPPAAPIHPELVPELLAEYERERAS